MRRLLAEHRELTNAATKHSHQLRALLLAGDADDRAVARGRLADAVVVDLSKRPEPRAGTTERADREREIRRLAVVVCDCRAGLTTNHDRLRTLVNELAPGLTAQHRVGPVRAAEKILATE